MRLRLLSVPAAVIAIIPFIGAASSLAQPKPAKSLSCQRFQLDVQPKWISSVAWVPQRHQIVVTDPAQKTLLLYDPRGELSKSAPLQFNSNFIPAFVQPVGSSFIVKGAGSRAFWLSPDLSLGGEVDLRIGPRGEQNRIGSIYDWASNGAFVLAYGAVHGAPVALDRTSTPGRSYQLGFFSAPVNGKRFSGARMLLPFDQNSYYLLGYHYLTASAEYGYFAAVGTELRLFQVGPGGVRSLRELRAVPKGFDDLPGLPKSTGPESTVKIFDALERSKIPVGLYSFEGRLFLLTRQPVSNGTEWSVYVIAPGSDEILGHLILPTNANHLDIVFGSTELFAFEKGRVQSWGEQEISSLLSIPLSWITQPKISPLSAPNPEVRACD